MRQEYGGKKHDTEELTERKLMCTSTLWKEDQSFSTPVEWVFISWTGSYQRYQGPRYSDTSETNSALITFSWTRTWLRHTRGAEYNSGVSALARSQAILRQLSSSIVNYLAVRYTPLIFTVRSLTCRKPRWIFIVTECLHPLRAGSAGTAEPRSRICRGMSPTSMVSRRPFQSQFPTWTLCGTGSLMDSPIWRPLIYRPAKPHGISVSLQKWSMISRSHGNVKKSPGIWGIW